MKTTTKRCEPVTQVSKVSGGLVRTLVLLTIAGLTLPGCKVEGGGSGGGRTVVGYGLDFENPIPLDDADPTPAHTDHSFTFRTAELEAEQTISGVTGTWFGHEHFLTIDRLQLVQFGINGSLIEGTTFPSSFLPAVSAHTHVWKIGGN